MTSLFSFTVSSARSRVQLSQCRVEEPFTWKTGVKMLHVMRFILLLGLAL